MKPILSIGFIRPKFELGYTFVIKCIRTQRIVVVMQENEFYKGIPNKIRITLWNILVKMYWISCFQNAQWLWIELSSCILESLDDLRAWVPMVPPC